MFGRGKKLSVARAAEKDEWVVLQGDRHGRALLARFNASFQDATDKASYPIQVGVAIPLRDPDERGMPSGDEHNELEVIEDQIVAASALDAVLVGVVTTQSMREFVLYTESSDWIESFHRSLEAMVVGHAVQVMAKQDPSWDVYTEFLSQ